MEIAASGLDFEKKKGKFHSTVNILGIAYKPDGQVAARFSDAMKFDFENKKEMEAFQEEPIHYENQFDLASGQYTLKVAFNSGDASFGKLEKPLTIDPYDVKQFSVSGLALSKHVHKMSDQDVGLDAALLADRTPLVVKGVQVIPSGTNRFKKTDHAALYAEVYEPLLLGAAKPRVAVGLRVLDRKSGEQKFDSGMIDMSATMQAGSQVIPVGLQVPFENLAAGSYRAEFKAVDSAGKTATLRSADFEVE